MAAEPRRALQSQPTDSGTRARGAEGEAMTTATRPRRLRLTLLVVTLLALACSSPPSEPAAPTPSPVDEVVEAHLAARGGKEKLRALRSTRETGTITASDGRVARVVR